MKLKSYISQWMSVHCHLVGIVRRTMMLLCCCTLAFVYLGCAKVDLIFLNPEGYVVISPDNSVHSLSGITYHFYPVDNSAPTTFGCNESGGLLAALPPASYCILGTNLKAANVSIDGLGSRETAIATSLTPSLSKGEGESLLSQPGDLFSITTQEFTCVKRDTVWHYPKPILLTKRILFIISLDDALKERVTSISGTLSSVYPSVHLFTCQTEDENINPTTGTIDFPLLPVSAAIPSTWTTEVTLFGIRNPEYGSAYRNKLLLTVAFGDEIKYLAPEITNNLSDAMYANGGALPSKLPIEIKLIQTDDLSLSADVIPWKTSGTGEGVIEE